VLAPLLPRYADIKADIVVDYGLVDIVAEHYDAGIRFGEQVAKDMVAARIGPDMRKAVVGAPSYFARRPQPKQPQDLTAHDCIDLRLPTYGGLYTWEFETRGRQLKVRVEGQLVFNNLALRLDAALGRARHSCPRTKFRFTSQTADPSARRLVSALFRLPPLLPEPPPTYAGVRLAGRCAALPRLKQSYFGSLSGAKRLPTNRSAQEESIRQVRVNQASPETERYLASAAWSLLRGQ
jgi:hypothetical protein